MKKGFGKVFLIYNYNLISMSNKECKLEKQIRNSAFCINSKKHTQFFL